MRGNGATIFSSLADVATDGLQIAAPLFQATLHDEADQPFGQIHEVVELGVGDFGLNHPELGQVAAGLRFFRAEGRPERIHLAQSHRRGFDVKLTGLREISLLIKIINGEKRAGSLASRRSKNRRIGQGKSVFVEKVTRGFDDFCTHPQDRCLARSAHPKMPVLHQEFHAVLFQGNRIGIVLGDTLQHLHIRYIEFVPAGRALVGAHFAFDNHARLLREAFDGIEDFGRNRALGHHSLNHAGAIAELWKQQLPAFAQVVKPAANSDSLAFVLANLGDGGYRERHKV